VIGDNDSSPIRKIKGGLFTVSGIMPMVQPVVIRRGITVMQRPRATGLGAAFLIVGGYILFQLWRDLRPD